MSLEFRSYEITQRVNGNGEVFARISRRDKAGNKMNKEHEVKCTRFPQCRGASYNEGFVRYLCSSDPMQCATANPDISMHPTELLGQRVSRFTQIEEYGNYA